MTVFDSDEITKLVREIDEHFPHGGLVPLLLDFCHLTSGTSYESVWDVPDTELLATIRELAESLRVNAEAVAAGEEPRMDEQ